ncbi:hypothetical protein [Vibrio mediterranei]|uniref:hypothetical protein n=1 Tax=Vibrio mediterranei TaxID=689 RepID=UPI001EFD3BDF|nr:hypothetical protein [Vibrio mediterranei]MCG9659937.1 hypothetical protein [Vibrio mediterranei]
MKLDVDFSGLSLAAAEMSGLETLLDELRSQKIPYDDALARACEFVQANNGKAVNLPGGITRLTLGDEECDCFQPYPDIDLIYYEK